MRRPTIRPLLATITATGLLVALASITPAAATPGADMALALHISRSGTHVAMPLAGTVTNMMIDWGDSTTTGPYNTPGAKSHTYATIGNWDCCRLS